MEQIKSEVDPKIGLQMSIGANSSITITFHSPSSENPTEYKIVGNQMSRFDDTSGSFEFTVYINQKQEFRVYPRSYSTREPLYDDTLYQVIQVLGDHLTDLGKLAGIDPYLLKSFKQLNERVFPRLDRRHLIKAAVKKIKKELKEASDEKIRYYFAHGLNEEDY